VRILFPLNLFVFPHLEINVCFVIEALYHRAICQTSSFEYTILYFQLSRSVYSDTFSVIFTNSHTQIHVQGHTKRTQPDDLNFFFNHRIHLCARAITLSAISQIRDFFFKHISSERR